MSAHHVGAWDPEARRGHQVGWNSSYQMVVSHLWMLGIEPQPYARASSALNHWGVSPAPQDFHSSKRKRKWKGMKGRREEGEQEVR